MKKELNLPLKSGFYLTTHHLVTEDGMCMPVLGRTRDAYMYTLHAEPVDEEHIPLDDNIAMMVIEDVKEALEEGGVGYYTVGSVPVVPYPLFEGWAEKDYILFAVKISDIMYDPQLKCSAIPLERRMHFIEARFPSMENDAGCPPPSEWEFDAGLSADMKILEASIKMEQKRPKRIKGYDITTADKIMKAIRRN